MSPTMRCDLSLGAEDFLDAQGDALRRTGMNAVAREAFETGARLVSPGLVYEWHPVGVSTGPRVQVGGVVFNLGRHANLLADAESAFVGLVSIGAALEDKARELAAGRKALESFMLGEVGVFYVGALVAEAHRIVEREAAARGLGVGAELAPGQLAGWAIAEQTLLCELLDAESVGVRVTGTGMLVPQKSASLMVGIGPRYTSSIVRSPCEYCEMGQTCRYRH